MKKLLLPLLFFSTISLKIFSQNNCSNPVQVDICPSVYLTNQTNAGMGDDMPGVCNITGEDVVYRISAPNGADNISVSVINSSGPFLLTLSTSTCTGSCTSYNLGAGNSNVVFPAVSASTYFLWVDAPSTITYGISIAGDTGGSWINIPDTRGNLMFDNGGCASPVFNSSKPYYQVSYNGVYKTHPMTLAPLGVTGSLCITTFFKNTTGTEGVKKFDFTFDPNGYSSTNAPSFVPGNYRLGDWVGTKIGNTWSFVFFDNLGSNCGDFSGTPNTCLSYTFCFDVIPITNNPALTNVGVNIYSDGCGAGYNGFVASGCCPILNPFCGGAGPGAPPPPQAFTFDFNDPPLPVKLLDFRAVYKSKKVLLKWTTASEINNSFFTIEKSSDGKEWIEADRLQGSGNSSSKISYETIDNNPFHGISYYRLKQTDFDGQSENLKVVRVDENTPVEIKIYPNPASDYIIIEDNQLSSLTYKIYNNIGQEIYLPKNAINQSGVLNTSELQTGIYFLSILQDEEIIKREKIIINQKY
jgi:hypothetical protein